jgi:hypothetical protein
MTTNRVDGAAGGAPDGAIDGNVAVSPGDPGRVPIHRLTKVEYDNTAKDLLGVTTTPAVRFEDDVWGGDLDGFDNLAENLRMSPGRYLQYFEVAKSLADQVWASPALRDRIVTCAPDGTGQCARRIVAAFGARAWRRPLTDAEVAKLGEVADAALVQTGDFQQSIKRVVTVMLSSVPFLYKVEIDPQPTSLVAHPLTGAELASRLSYLLWSTMPDDTLRALGDGLRDDAVLDQQLDRMLADPRSDAFVRNFAGQWLGIRELAAHSASPVAYPAWDEALRDAMVKEMNLFFTTLIDASFDGFLRADLHFVNGRLGHHYALAQPPMGNTDFVRVAGATGRVGFLGLAGFATLTSPSNRTSPSQRGSWVLGHLLCTPPPPPPPNVPPGDIDPSASPNTRKALERSLTSVACTTCHRIFDGIGFGLENFDGIGQFRSSYAPGEPIDATGQLEDGTKVNGATELGAALAADPRLATCAVRKTLSYALGRRLDDGDREEVAALADAWRQGTFRQLLRAIVLSDAFRLRRGEAP